MCVYLVMSNSLQPSGVQPTRLHCPWNFSGKNNWPGLPFPPPGDLAYPGIEPTSPVSSALAGESFATEPPGKTPCLAYPKCYSSILRNTGRILMTCCCYC